MTILLVTWPVQESLPTTFLLGMFAATLLEGLSGLLMEWLFHVRLWDYSQIPLNWKGYICPQVSLVWGCFSVLLVRFLLPILDDTVLSIPTHPADTLSLVLTILFTVDVVRSTQDALGLKTLLTHRLPNPERIKAWLESEAFPSWDTPLRRSLSLLRRNPGAISHRHREIMETLKKWKPDKSPQSRQPPHQKKR